MVVSTYIRRRPCHGPCRAMPPCAWTCMLLGLISGSGTAAIIVSNLGEPTSTVVLVASPYDLGPGHRREGAFVSSCHTSAWSMEG